jgi:tetratricopeptide (TPR) repeat protein
MSLKPKTSKRLLALGGIVLLLAAGAGGALVYRKHRQEAQIKAFRTEGMAYVEQGEYYKGLGALNKYLKRNDTDLDALLAYAKARENIEEPDGTHIKQALDIYQKVQSIRPTDDNARHLLELYQVAGYLPEARDQAAKMRPEDLAKCTDEHFDMLRAEANARMGIKPDDERISAILQRMLELRPSDFPTQVVLVEHLRDRGKAGEGRAIAKKLLDSTDVTAKAQGRLLMALARRDEPGFDVNAEAFQALCALTGIDLETAGIAREVQFASPLEVLRSASLFDGMGMHAHALTVLRVGYKQHADEILARVLARRSWMSGRFNDVLSLFPEPDLGIRGTNSEILVYRALSLLSQDQHDDIKTIVDAFGKREGDFRAAAWGPVLNSLIAQPQPAPAEQLAIIEKALDEAKNDPVLLVFQGDALERLGRLGDARASWEKASTSSLALGWVQPWLKRANLALAQGRPLAAVQASIPAMRIAPRSMGVFSTYFRSNVALIDAGYGDQVNGGELLATANRIDDELALSEQTPDIKNFRENILPGRVLLTSRVRGSDQARNTLEKGLNSLGELSPEGLGELFQIAQRENIDADSLLLPRMDKAEGMTPRTGLARASSLFKQGKRDEAMTLLRENFEKAQGDQKKAWLRAQAAFAESANLPDAKGNWAAFADAYPTDIDAQLAALASPAVQTDLTLVDRLIARARELGRFDELNTPAQLRMARARALMTEPVDRNRRAEAINVLRDLALRESDLLEARALLVAALSMDRPESGIVPQRTDAITQLRTLIPLVPDPTPWQLELARMLRGEGDLAGARSELDRLANMPNVPLNVRLAATEELIRMRELNSAASSLERMRSQAPAQDKPLIELTLANAYRAMVRDRDALAMFRTIDPSAMQTPQQVLALAEGLASLGDKERA